MNTEDGPTSDEYTPTTAEIRKGYIGYPRHFLDEAVGAEFDRWLAEHDADVLRRVAADDPDNLGLSGLLVAALSRAEAAEAVIAALREALGRVMVAFDAAISGAAVSHPEPTP